MSKRVICVLHYGTANVGSMLNMLRKCEADARAISTPEEVLVADKLILPGIGSFDNGVRALDSLGLMDAIRHRVRHDAVPLLGVCLGMQLLGESSEEGVLAGLGLIKAKCVRLQPDPSTSLRVPHMGWSQLICRRESPVLANLGADARFYFVHSYHVSCADSEDLVAVADYGGPFTAVIQRDSVWGVQFHPEKSHRFGLQLLRNFASL